MSRFIELTDYDASIHREILASLTREDEAIVEICEGRAVAQMRGYLSRRYDTEAIFSAKGDERHPLVLMMALDIAIYHIFSIHNPANLKPMRKDRYDRAMEWLRQVAGEEISIDGAPLLPTAERAAKAAFLTASNPRRVNHY
jgi:phage gp36-like protein